MSPGMRVEKISHLPTINWYILWSMKHQNIISIPCRNARIFHGWEVWFQGKVVLSGTGSEIILSLGIQSDLPTISFISIREILCGKTVQCFRFFQPHGCACTWHFVKFILSARGQANKGGFWSKGGAMDRGASYIYAVWGPFKSPSIKEPLLISRRFDP